MKFPPILNANHKFILTHLAEGSTLKAHRDIDGGKVYRLHLLDGTVLMPAAKVIEQLKSAHYIDSNKKFPAATYLLTERGRLAAETLTEGEIFVLSAKNYGSL